MSLQALQEAVRRAAGAGAALRLRGGGTKDFYGNPPAGAMLDTRSHAGVVSYEPTELVLTARCGTPLAEIEAVLEERGQCLPFEPPHFGAGATLGGCIAAGLSGPRRASAGALRDFVLGVKLVDGRGRLLAFGGQVMKNVAGYDVSRLLAGSLGTLGLIVEASLKVLPRPALERTLRLELSCEQAVAQCNRWAAEPLPISATAWHDGELAVRISGAEAALGPAAKKIGGDPLGEQHARELWASIREHRHPFFEGSAPLWRLAVPSSVPALSLDGPQLVEWSGGQRWLRSDAPADTLRERARRVGGHATLFRAADPARKAVGAFAPPDAAIMRLHRELKAAFDPAGVFNPGRLYAGL